jgi:hypothetical protein
VIYLGFYLRCSQDNCPLPVSFVISQNCYRYPNHIKDLIRCHTSLHIPVGSGFYLHQHEIKQVKKPPYFYANQIDIKSCCSNTATKVHNKRLGINYDIQINVFKNFTKSTQSLSQQQTFNINS